MKILPQKILRWKATDNCNVWKVSVKQSSCQLRWYSSKVCIFQDTIPFLHKVWRYSELNWASPPNNLVYWLCSEQGTSDWTIFRVSSYYSHSVLMSFCQHRGLRKCRQQLPFSYLYEYSFAWKVFFHFKRLGFLFVLFC